MLKDYSIGLGNYLENVFSAQGLKAIESKRDDAFENYARHHDKEKLNMPFITYDMTGDVGLDTARYVSFIHRSGIVVETNITTKKATRIRAIPITHPYAIEFWAPSKDYISTMRRTFWIAVMDSPVVNVFCRSVDRNYRVSLDVESSVAESVAPVEERAGYYNSTVNANLGVWIRLSTETDVIAKAIIEYIQSPEDYILGITTYE